MSVSELSGKDYAEFVSRKGVVLVDFWADWCGPCKAMKPVLNEIGKKLSGKVRVGMVDVDEECALAGQMQISSLPHFAIYKDGKMVDSIQGALPPASLNSRIEKFL